MTRRTYTPEQKAEALALYVQEGPAEAARLTGIAKGTIAAWAHRDGLQTHCAENTRERVEIIKAQTEERKRTVSRRLWEIAEAATARELELIGDDKTALRDLVGARTRAIHDAQLLEGGATQRLDLPRRQADVADGAGDTALRLVG